MAGGTAADIRTPWPKGEEGLVLLQSNPVTVQASKTGHQWDQMLVPFAFKPVRAEICAESITDADASCAFTVQDDTGTPKKVIDAAATTAMADGSSVRAALTVDKTVTIFAGALLDFLYTSTGSDASVNLVIRIWVKPIN